LGEKKKQIGGKLAPGTSKKKTGREAGTCENVVLTKKSKDTTRSRLKGHRRWVERNWGMLNYQESRKDVFVGSVIKREGARGTKIRRNNDKEEGDCRNLSLKSFAGWGKKNDDKQSLKPGTVGGVWGKHT